MKTIQVVETILSIYFSPCNTCFKKLSCLYLFSHSLATLYLPEIMSRVRGRKQIISCFSAVTTLFPHVEHLPQIHMMNEKQHKSVLLSLYCMCAGWCENTRWCFRRTIQHNLTGTIMSTEEDKSSHFDQSVCQIFGSNMQNGMMESFSEILSSHNCWQLRRRAESGR